jgi:hypothetical protein
MMETAVEQAAASSRPIMVIANPSTWEDALCNQIAFSDEARLAQPSPDQLAPDSDLRPITSMPRLRKCYGWLTLKSEVFSGLSLKLAPPVLQVDKVTRFLHPGKGKEYMAIVYEYVEEGENDPDTIQQAFDFFWLAGFCTTLSQLPKNWVSGVLVDLCEIVPPRGYGWKWQLYRDGPYSAQAVVQQNVGTRTSAFEGPPRTRPPKPPPARPSNLSVFFGY